MLSVCSVKQDTGGKESLHPCLTQTIQELQATPCTKGGGEGSALRSDLD